MPFKLLALQIRTIGALCPWFPLGGPSMRRAGGERTSEAIGARHCAGRGWVKVFRHPDAGAGNGRDPPARLGRLEATVDLPAMNRRGLASRLAGMSV